MSAADRAAIRAAFRETSPDLLVYFERRLTDREEAADLLGQTMLTAWRRVEKMPADVERQRMWLFVIAANTLSNHRRTWQHRLALADRLRDHLAASTPASEFGDAHAVRDAVLRLHNAQRELVMLIHWDGFTIVEAAEILGLNPSTARSRYATAKESLRTALVEANSI